MENGTIYRVTGWNNETLYTKIVDSWANLFFDFCPCDENGNLLPNAKRANSITRSEVQKLIDEGHWFLHKTV